MSIRARTVLVIILCNVLILFLSILVGTGYARRHIKEYIEADMLVVADIADRFISAELDVLRGGRRRRQSLRNGTGGAV